jgi:hypothetical protein
MQGLRKIKINFGQGSRCFGQDSEEGSSGFKSELSFSQDMNEKFEGII